MSCLSSADPACAPASFLRHPLSGRLRRPPTVLCLSNRSAGGKVRRRYERCEENSGVQRVWERCSRCGEINSIKGCGDSPARWILKLASAMHSHHSEHGAGSEHCRYLSLYGVRTVAGWKCDKRHRPMWPLRGNQFAHSVCPPIEVLDTQ